MKELEQAITTAFADMVDSGKLKKTIEDAVQGSVARALTDCFHSYSPFHKSLSEHINKSLGVDLSSLGLSGYNATLLQIIKAKLDANICRFADEQFAKSLEKLLADAPPEIKLSDLVEKFRRFANDENECDNGISCHLVMSEGSCRGYGRLHLDIKSGKDAWNCRYHISFADKGEIYNISLPDSGDPSKRIFAGPFYGFDRMLFQMYAAKTKLILDRDADSIGE